MLYANLYQAGGEQFIGLGYATRGEADTAASQTSAQRIMVVRIVASEPVEVLGPRPARGRA